MDSHFWLDRPWHVFNEPERSQDERLAFVVAIAFVPIVAFLFLVVRRGAPSSVLAPSSDALCY